MWLPSFVAVLHDLWLFCTGRGVVVVDGTLFHTNPAFTGRPAAHVAQSNPIQKLQIEVAYVKDQVVTQAIRSTLRDYDPHLVQNNQLTEKEWLLYFVHSKRPSIPLLALQLTPVGLWHTTLKGQSEVSVDVTPYSDSLMEWRKGTKDQAAVVLQVTPEEMITIGELGTGQIGLYEKRTLTKAEWLELQPVFTTFV
jgi:hypothetical protein